MAAAPRIVTVTRATEYEQLLHQHATHGQAAFFLASREQSIDAVQHRHELQHEALRSVLAQVPEEWRRASVARDDLARYLFEPGDVVVAVGQDGLVANVARYLHGQPVIGINPDPESIPGLLVQHRAGDAGELLQLAAAGQATIDERTMVRAVSDDGRVLRCLNEVFIGHRSHQSARYLLAANGGSELQSSSGLVITTGTGATGWGASIHLGRRTDVELPDARDRSLAFFVREAFPGFDGPAAITDGIIAPGQTVDLTSRMEGGGIAFGDGIESDAIQLPWGARLRVDVAPDVLRLVA